MIVLDEQICGPSIAQPVAAWYPGRVIPITALRPRTVIHDDAIATLLRGLSQPTFVTINVSDFWRVLRSDSHYAVVCIDLPTAEALEISTWLRRLFQLHDFKTKAARMGRVVRLRPSGIEYYGFDGNLRTVSWIE